MNQRSLVGSRSGSLVVISEDARKNGRTGVACVCDCGNHKVVEKCDFVRGKQKSCGCLQQFRHGTSRTPTYKRWRGMIARCHYPLRRDYERYGGRGIFVCDRWRDSFKNFYADMGPRPSPQHSIDRINNDGPYSPENCRWATRSEQGRNCRNNVRVSAFGEVKLLVEWSEDRRCAVECATLRHRICGGWDSERAITTPARRSVRERVSA